LCRGVLVFAIDRHCEIELSVFLVVEFANRLLYSFIAATIV